MKKALLFAALAAAGCVSARPVTLCAHLQGASDSVIDALDPVHQGEAVLDFKGIPLAKWRKLVEALMADEDLAATVRQEDKAPEA